MIFFRETTNFAIEKLPKLQYNSNIRKSGIAENFLRCEKLSLSYIRFFKTYEQTKEKVLSLMHKYIKSAAGNAVGHIQLERLV